MLVSLSKLVYQVATFRTPFKFGPSVITELFVPHVELSLSSGDQKSTGYGAMPLGNAWSFPAAPYNLSLEAMRSIVDAMGVELASWETSDNLIDASLALRQLARRVTRETAFELFHDPVAIPDLCMLVSSSCFDIALFDAWGKLSAENTFATLRKGDAGPDLSQWLGNEFIGYSMADLLPARPVEQLSIFHVVGGLDPLTPAEAPPATDDGLPVDLVAWIARDGLTHFKVKMRGIDPAWDFSRIVAVDHACLKPVRERHGHDPIYSLDLNEQCPSGEVLLQFLQRLQSEAPDVLSRIEFIEQPTARDYTGGNDDSIRKAAQIKPIVLDEGLTDIEALESALVLGYNGVCLKACKGMVFSLLCAAIARKRNLFLCVQDLTCPGIAFAASAALASWVGVEALEANARQFCPTANVMSAASVPELFNLVDGKVRTTYLASAEGVLGEMSAG